MADKTPNMEIDTDKWNSRIPSSPYLDKSPVATSTNTTASNPRTPTRINSSRRQFYPNPHGSDSESDNEDLVERLNRERQEKRERTLNPLSSSSPIREVDGLKFMSRAIGDKYTLRTNRYVPFRSQRKLREQRRAEKQLEIRGGIDGMDRDITLQQERDRLKRLNEEANSYHLEEIDELEEFDGDDEFDEEAYLSQRHELDQRKQTYQEELEKMIMLEDEELETMIREFNLAD